MYCVYVLRSVKNQRLYTGFTSDLERRLTEHNSGHTKSIRYSGPYEVVYVEKGFSHLEAVRRERFLKSGQGREELKKILSPLVGSAGVGVARG